MRSYRKLGYQINRKNIFKTLEIPKSLWYNIGCYQPNYGNLLLIRSKRLKCCRREVKQMEVVKIILTVLEVIASLVMVVVVLAQSGKEAGLSGALSGNSDSYLSKSGKGGLDKLLARATKWVALAWLLLTLSLSLIP